MVRKVRLCVSFMLVFLMLFMMIPASVQAAKGGVTPVKPEKETVTVNYVALGDSIATGTVTYWSSITSYVTYFHEYLKSYYGRKTTVTMQNLAHDGDRTNELLAKLESDTSVIEAVTNAEVITISIGGNNLLQAAEVPGFTNIDWALADQGLIDFKEQWVPIIENIKSLNPNTKIIVSTVYNPYNIDPPFGYEADEGLHEAVDSYLTTINTLILENQDSLGYKVADTFTDYDAYQNSSMGEITYFYPSLFSYLFRNPHPNSSGQEIITELHKEAFLSF